MAFIIGLFVCATTALIAPADRIRATTGENFLFIILDNLNSSNSIKSCSSCRGFFKLRGHENKITSYYRINLRSVRFLLGPELADDCDYARKHWRQQRSLQRRASLDIDHDQNEDRIGR